MPYRQRKESVAPLRGIISAGSYKAEHMKRGVKWLKFKGVREIAPVLAQLLVPYLPIIAPVEQLRKQAVIVPIPLHKRRERERGFNQSLEIARSLTEVTKIPVLEALERTRATHSQANLPPGDLRRQNLKDAFEIKSSLPKRKYFLVLDDVTTTGATLQAAGEALKQQLPKAQLWGVTIARG